MCALVRRQTAKTTFLTTSVAQPTEGPCRQRAEAGAGQRRVKAWCYEPPGGLMTRTVSRALQPLCTSTALGKDWIPRLSVASFERMRDDMVRPATPAAAPPPCACAPACSLSLGSHAHAGGLWLPAS